MPKPSTALEIRLYDALKTIAKGYQTPEQLRRNAERDYGLDAGEAIEYAYENIQGLAARAIKGVRITRPTPSKDNALGDAQDRMGRDEG